MAFTPNQELIESAGKINTEDFGRRVRVHSVAKQLGITSKEFIGVLGEFGITGKVPSSTLSKEEAADIVARLAGGADSQKPKGEKAEKSEPKKAEPEKAEPAKVNAEDSDSAELKKAQKSSGKKAAKKAQKAAAKKSAPKAEKDAADKAEKKAEKKAGAKAEKKAENKPAEKPKKQKKAGKEQASEQAKKAAAQQQPESEKQSATTAEAASQGKKGAEQSSEEGTDKQAAQAKAEAKPARRRVRRVVRRVGSRAIKQESSGRGQERTQDKDRDKAQEQPRRKGQGESQGKGHEGKNKDHGAPAGKPEQQGKKQDQQQKQDQKAQGKGEVPADQLHPGDRGEEDIVDEPVRLKGSTRLESKRRWREENRERGRKKVISRSEFLARRESVHRQMMVRDSERHDHNGLTTQVGVVEDGQLVEHFVTSDTQQSMIGNIYLGRVQNVLASMEAAFVDIGTGRNAVLYASEVNWHSPHLHSKSRRIDQALRSGDQVMVQVIKDPVGHKGARLTNRISFAGRYLVYFPGGTTAGISRKLPEPERKRLKEILQRVVPGQGGAIIRTAAENVAEDLIEEDVNRLHKQWLKIEEIEAKERKSKGAKPVTLYEEPNMLITVIRDLFNEDFSELLVEGEKSWRMVRDYMGRMAPELMERVHKWHPEQHADEDVFAAHRLDDQLAKALSRKVWLPSGGHLVIDHTEAMTVIDVNTGSFVGSGGNLEETVTENNLEAAEEIVRQMRLRDIGGMIVVDFIDMVLEENQDLVLRRLIEYLGRDRTHHKVSEVTSLGLVQITRKRLGAGLLETFSTTCECCGGRGVIVHPDPVEQDLNAEPERHRRRSGGHDRDDRGRGEKSRHGKGQNAQGQNSQGHGGKGGKDKPHHGNRHGGKRQTDEGHNHKGHNDGRQGHKGRNHDGQRHGHDGQDSRGAQPSKEQSGKDQHSEDTPRTGRRRRRVVSRRSSTARGANQRQQQAEQRDQDRRGSRRSSSRSQDASSHGQHQAADQASAKSQSGDAEKTTQQRTPRRMVRRRIVRRTAPGQARAGQNQRRATEQKDAPELKVASRQERAERQSRGEAGEAPRRRGRRVVRSTRSNRQPGAKRGGRGEGQPQRGGQKRPEKNQDRPADQRGKGTRHMRGAGSYEEAVKEFESSPRRRRRTRGNSVSDHRPRPEDYGQQSDRAGGSRTPAGKGSEKSSGTASGGRRTRRRRVVRSSRNR